MVENLPDLWRQPDAELSLYRQFTEQRHRRAQIRAQSTAELAVAVTEHARAYPWMKPGVAMSLAQSGVDANSPLAATIARVSALQRSSDPDGWREPGEVVTDMVETRQEEARKVDTENLLERIVQPVARAFTTAGDALFTELVSRPIVAVGAAAAGDESIASAYAKSAPSAGLMALQDLMAGREVDLGSGFLPGGSLREKHERLKHNLQLDGQFVTPGRVFSRLVFEPGTTAYNVTSGIIDAALQIAADPMSKGLGGIAKIQRARAAFDADPQLFARTKRLVGVVDGGHRPTVMRDRALQWAQSAPEAQRLWERVAEEGDFLTMWRSPIGRALSKVPDGRQVISALTRASDPNEVFQIVKPFLGVELSAKPMATGLAGAIAGPFGIGAAVAETTLPLLGKRVDEIRMFHDIPNQKIVWENLEDGLAVIHAYGRNAKLSSARISEYMRRWADIGSPLAAKTAGYEVVTDLLDEIETELVSKWGKSKLTAHKLTRLADQLHGDGGVFLQNAVADGTAKLGGLGVVDGKALRSKTGPYVLAEAMNEGMTLPDFRAMRRATSRIGPVLDLPGVNGSVMVANFAMDHAWRPLAVAKSGWAFKLFLEGQMRMAAAGFDALPNHLFKYLMYWAGRKGDDLTPIGTKWKDTAEWQKGTNLTLYAAGGRSQVELARHSGMRLVPSTHPAAPDAWADTIMRMRTDPVLQRLARAADTEDVKAWFKSREGESIRKASARLRGEGAIATDAAAADLYIDEVAQILRTHTGDNPVVRALIAGDKSFVAAQQGFKAGVKVRAGDAKKIGVIAAIDDATGSATVQFTNKADGAVTTGAFALDDLQAVGRKAAKGKDDLATVREQLADQLDSMPGEVLAPVHLVERGGDKAAEHLLKQWDAALEWGFYHIGTKWEAMWNRSPAFRQAVVRHLDRFSDHLSEDAAADLATWARAEGAKRNLPPDIVKRFDSAAVNARGRKPVFAPRQGDAAHPWEMTLDEFEDAALAADDTVDLAALTGQHRAAVEQALTDGKKVPLEAITEHGDLYRSHIGDGPRILDLAEAHRLAVALGLDDSLNVLYDVTRRGQWADIMRAIIPFGEAWKEIVTTWSRLTVNEPKVLRRAQQVVEGARGAGFFYVDPRSGEETFAWPGVGGMVSQLLFGTDTAKAEFTGSVSGLNLVTASLLPGAGPLVQIPAAVLLPKSPKWDWVNSAINPFGEPDVEGGVAEALMPAYMRKIVTAFFDSPEKNRVFGNTVKDVLAALVDSGEYSLSTPEEQKRALDAATHRARALTLIRGIAQFFSPTSPQVRFKKQDLKGNWWLTDVMAGEYRRLAYEEGLGEEGAMQSFIGRFGDDANLWVESKSNMLAERPTTVQGSQWERAHPELVERYGNTVGFFTADAEFGTFDYQAYKRLFSEGAAEALTPRQWVQLSQATLGGIALDRAKRLIGLSAKPGSREYVSMVAAVREQLIDLYPGFGTYTGTRGRADTETQIRELQKAVVDPDMVEASPEVTAALKLYFQYRQDALAVSRKMGLQTFRYADRARGVREQLRATAFEIAERTPEFLPVWERVLSRELSEDEFDLLPKELAA